MRQYLNLLILINRISVIVHDSISGACEIISFSFSNSVKVYSVGGTILNVIQSYMLFRLYKMNAILSISKVYKSGPYIYLFRLCFHFGKNNIRDPHTGTLLSSSLYSCYSGHHRDLSSHK